MPLRKKPEMKMSKLISIRVTNAQYEKLEKRVAAAVNRYGIDMNVSDYVRMRIL